jgi:hypothetical protein
VTVCCGLLVQIRAKVAQQTQYASFERTEEAPCPHDCTPPFAVTCLHTSNYPASSRRDWRRVARLSDDTPRLRGHPRCLAPGRFQTPLAVRSLGPFVCRNCCAYPAEITLIPGALTFPFDEPVRKPSEGTTTSTADRPTINITALSPSLLGSGGECSSTLLNNVLSPSLVGTSGGEYTPAPLANLRPKTSIMSTACTPRAVGGKHETTRTPPLRERATCEGNRHLCSHLLSPHRSHKNLLSVATHFAFCHLKYSTTTMQAVPALRRGLQIRTTEQREARIG